MSNNSDNKSSLLKRDGMKYIRSEEPKKKITVNNQKPLVQDYRVNQGALPGVIMNGISKTVSDTTRLPFSQNLQFSGGLATSSGGIQTLPYCANDLISLQGAPLIQSVKPSINGINPNSYVQIGTPVYLNNFNKGPLIGTTNTQYNFNPSVMRNIPMTEPNIITPSKEQLTNSMINTRIMSTMLFVNNQCYLFVYIPLSLLNRFVNSPIVHYDNEQTTFFVTIRSTATPSAFSALPSFVPEIQLSFDNCLITNSITCKHDANNIMFQILLPLSNSDSTILTTPLIQYQLSNGTLVIHINNKIIGQDSFSIASETTVKQKETKSNMNLLFANEPISSGSTVSLTNRQTLDMSSISADMSHYSSLIPSNSESNNTFQKTLLKNSVIPTSEKIIYEISEKTTDTPHANKNINNFDISGSHTNSLLSPSSSVKSNKSPNSPSGIHSLQSNNSDTSAPIDSFQSRNRRFIRYDSLLTVSCLPQREDYPIHHNSKIPVDMLNERLSVFPTICFKGRPLFVDIRKNKLYCLYCGKTLKYQISHINRHVVNNRHSQCTCFLYFRNRTPYPGTIYTNYDLSRYEAGLLMNLKHIVISPEEIELFRQWLNTSNNVVIVNKLSMLNSKIRAENEKNNQKESESDIEEDEEEENDDNSEHSSVYNKELSKQILIEHNHNFSNSSSQSESE